MRIKQNQIEITRTLGKLTSEVDDLKVSTATKLSTAEAKTLIQDSINAANTVQHSDTLIKKEVSEQVERLHRQNNVMLFNLSEPTDEDTVKEQDLTHIQDIFTNTFRQKLQTVGGLEKSQTQLVDL